MLKRVENAAAGIELIANAKKTKTMSFNNSTQIEIKAKNGSTLEVIEELTYLGSLMSSTAADVKMRIALAWP